jgi:hypothetical protein
MALPTQLPDGVRSALAEAVARWNSNTRDEISFDLRPLRILQPVPLYRLLRGADLHAAEPVGWRCFLKSKAGRIYAVDAVNAGDRFAFQLQMGDMATEWLRQVRLAKRRKQVREGRCELRTLIAPAAHLCRLWLAGAGTDDRLLPSAKR